MPENRRRTVQILSSCPAKDYDYRFLVQEKADISGLRNVIFSEADLGCDMSYLKELLQRKPLPGFIFRDFMSAKYVDHILEEKYPNLCYLSDDGLRKSREEIDLTQLKNIQLVIPLSYLVWGVSFPHEVKTYCFRYSYGPNQLEEYISRNGNKSISKDDLKKINQTIQELSYNHPRDAIEKLCLISDFLQSRTQFIRGRESTGGGRTFITPEFPTHCADDGHVETVLNQNRGVCMGIANLSTLLLNNPEFDLEVESVEGQQHVWNKVLIDGKYYYFDNTWEITRSDTPSLEGLFTLSFSKKHMLIGKESAERIGNHTVESDFIYQNGVFSEEDYQKAISYVSQFPYQEIPKYFSYRK